MGIGFPEIFLLTIALVVVGGTILGAVVLIRAFAGKAKRFGYPSTRAYLRAVPRTDAEKQDAVDLALKGLVFCVLGLIFPPFILIGLVPLFFGARKIVWASMGLGVIASLIDFPPAGPALLVLALGLVLYAKGLFSVTATPSPVRRGAAADTGSAPRR